MSARFRVAGRRSGRTAAHSRPALVARPLAGLKAVDLTAAGFAAVLLLASCSNPMRVTVESVVEEESRPVATIDFADGSGIARDTQIAVTFSESMDTSSLVLGGSLAEESDGGVWSEGAAENDTLTISPADAWSVGSGKTLTVQAADPDTYTNVPLNVTYGVLDGVVYVHGAAGSDENPGTSDQPKATVQAAVTTAERVYDEAEVHIAQGEYTTVAPIRIRKAVSLIGGFSADDWSSRETDPDWAVAGDGAMAYPTVIRSMYTSTGAAGEEPYPVAIESGDRVASLSYLELIGPVGTGSSALNAANSTVHVESCSLDGGGGSDITIALGIGGGSATVDRCKINAGSLGPGNGVMVYQADLVLSNCTIRGGEGDSSIGVQLIEATGEISGCTVYGGDATEQVVGIELRNTEAFLVYNNVIDAGTAPATTGVLVREGTATIANNVVHGGGAMEIGDATAEAFWFYSGGKATLWNNIAFVSSGLHLYGISRGGDSTPIDVADNVFFCWGGGAFEYVYYDYANNNHLGTVADLNSYFGATGDSVNVADDPELYQIGDPVFTGASPASVTEGGRDLSSLFTTDILAAPRTDDGAGGGWSMGAYEKD